MNKPFLPVALNEGFETLIYYYQQCSQCLLFGKYRVHYILQHLKFTIRKIYELCLPLCIPSTQPPIDFTGINSQRNVLRIPNLLIKICCCLLKDRIRGEMQGQTFSFSISQMALQHNNMLFTLQIEWEASRALMNNVYQQLIILFSIFILQPFQYSLEIYFITKKSVLDTCCMPGFTCCCCCFSNYLLPNPATFQCLFLS